MKQLEDLIVISKKRKQSGHPGDEVIGKLAIKYKHKNNLDKAFWSCVAIMDGCTSLHLAMPKNLSLTPCSALQVPF
jgi:hypothetical protein